MNYTGKLNLLKFRNACIVTVKGKTMSKKGVFIPIDENCLYMTAGDDGKAKGAYVDFIAWENSDKTKFGDTHAIKQSYPKEARLVMSDEELKSIPFMGNFRPFEQKSAGSGGVKSVGEVIEEMDDLPF